MSQRPLQDLRLVRRRPALTLVENGPLILEAIGLFGADRCMFASNFPVDSLKGSWDYIYTAFRQAVAHLPDAQQHGLFAGNAMRFYRIG